MIGLTDLLIKKRCASDWWMATARMGDHRAEALNFKLSAAQVVNVSEDEEKKWIEGKCIFYDNQLSKYTDC